MNTPKAARPIPLFLTALVAFFSAVAALAVSNCHDALAHGNQPNTEQAAVVIAHTPVMETRKAVALRTDMRRLWEDHITWTRLAIISLTTGAPDTEATVGRLLKNQTDIGNAVKPFYGKAAGNELTRHLEQHILIAADVIAAAKAGDQTKLADAQARWARNGDDIAEVLASVNPRFWKLEPIQAELRTHLKLTTDEAVARLQADWTADVAAYDKIHAHALHMSDLLAAGIVKQFPKRFSARR
jgi:hypothetical protein